MRLPNGTLTSLARETGIDKTSLCDLAATRKRPGRGRAKALERAARKIGRRVPAVLWLYGTSSEIKAALTGRPKL